MAESLCMMSLKVAALSPASLRSLQKPALEGSGLGGSSSSNAGATSRSSKKKVVVTCATESVGGTRYIGGKRVKVLQVGDKSANLRDKVTGEPAAVKLLSRVEQLRLLSKAERAGLLSAVENAGLSLSTIERLGLLSKAEDFGLLSAATDPNTPGSLLTIALLLLIVGPVFVYLVPEDATWQLVLQSLVAVVSILGGSAAFAASNLVSTLQNSD